MNEFENYEKFYEPNGLLRNNVDIPPIINKPIFEEPSVIKIYPNPQLHTREGMRGFWITDCFECGTEIVTSINPNKGRAKGVTLFKGIGKPKAVFASKILICCSDCKPLSEEYLKDDEEFLAHCEKLAINRNIRSIRKHQLKNSEKYAILRKDYREKNLERYSNVQKLWREKNKEKVKALAKAYREKNKEKFKIYQINYRLKQKLLLTPHSKHGKNLVGGELSLRTLPRNHLKGGN